jgi:hypothetical protein
MKRPRGSISISHVNVSRSTLGFSEQMPFESRSGSIGMARPGK